MTETITALDMVYDALPMSFTTRLFREKLEAKGIKKPRPLSKYLLSKGAYQSKHYWRKPGYEGKQWNTPAAANPNFDYRYR